MVSVREKINKRNKIFFLGGLAAVLLSFIPFILLGTDSIVVYHDQLDGELIVYLLRAKYLFSGSDVIPEFLGGASKTALTPPAPFAVLLFRLLPPFTAYLCMQFAGQLAAYLGMYFLTEEFTQKEWIRAGVALLFAFLPFLPVYGLTQYGLPMLCVCVWNLYHKRKMGEVF